MQSNGADWMGDAPQSLRDLITRLEEHLPPSTGNPYMDIERPQHPYDPMKAVLPAAIAPCAVPTMGPIQRVIDCHLVPRIIQILHKFKRDLVCGTYHVQPPAYQVPPASARCFDLYNRLPVVIGPGETILIFEGVVPDRYFGIIHSIGVALEDPANFGLVTWHLTINDRPVPCYGQFTIQPGPFNNPTRIGAPYHLKGLDVVRMTATSTLLDGAVTVFGKILGYIVPAQQVTDDGSFGIFHVT